MCNTFDIRLVLKKWKSKWGPFSDYDTVKLKQCCTSVNIKVCTTMYKSDSSLDTNMTTHSYDRSQQCDIESSGDD